MAASLAAVASAQEVVLPPEVTVSGNYENAISTSDAASEGAVTARLIESRPLLRPGELLEFVPGVIVTQHSGDGKANQYFLRGFNLDHGTDFATFVDGMPVNMRSHAHGQGYTDLNFVIPELVDRIAYRKGPYFAEDGDFASAGSARLALKNRLPQGLAAFTVGERGYRRLLAADSTRVGDTSLLYAVEAGTVDGPWENPERLRRLSALLRLSGGTPQNGFSLTAMAYTAKWNSTDQIPRRAVDNGAVGRFGAVDATDGGDTARYSLSWNLRRQSAEAAFDFNAYAVRSRLDLFSNFTYALDDPVNGDQFLQRERRSLAGFDTSHTWFGNLGGMASTTRLGAQGRFDKLSPVGLYATAARAVLSTTREDRIVQGSLGLFVENTLQWHEKLRSIVGLRYDRYRFGVTSNNAANTGAVADGIASPKLSVIFGPWARTEFFANTGRGFHSNDARGTTQAFAPKSGLATTPVTPLVRTRGFEFGVRSEAFRGLQSSLALWRLDIDSELVFVGDAGETAPSRASRRSGIEWNNRYVVAPWLAFDLDVAWSRARFKSFNPAADLGTNIPGALEKALSFGVSVRDRGRWSGHVHWRYLGARPLIDDNSVRSAPTSLAHARAGYRVSGNTRLMLDVFNLFNRKASDIDYFYESRLRGEAASVSDVHFHPVEPRALRLTLATGF